MHRGKHESINENKNNLELPREVWHPILNCYKIYNHSRKNKCRKSEIASARVYNDKTKSPNCLEYTALNKRINPVLTWF